MSVQALRKNKCDVCLFVISDLHQHKCGRGLEAAGELLVVREKKLVDKYMVKTGMLRFSFLLECCQPGSFPDSQLMAAMLDLVGCRALLFLSLFLFHSVLVLLSVVCVCVYNMCDSKLIAD